MRGAQPFFVSGDVDGFFGLAIDNLIQFILILALSSGVLGMSVDHILGTVIPGAAVSVLVGNLFYAWQAQRLSAKTGRKDITALPYGINTVSLFAYVFLVMLPVKLAALAGGASATEAAKVAWQVGLASCMVSGAIELLGSLVAEPIRKATPRAALLSTLAGIAISFIAIDFAIRTFEAPLVAILPLAVILATYFSRTKMPFRLPGGLWAVALGTGAAWLMVALGQPSPVTSSGVGAALGTVGFHPPIPVLGDVIAGFSHPLFMQFLVPVMVPMGLFNVLGSLQNIESADAAGDSYPTMPSLAVNGGGSIIAAFFGSCYPTTIYIGHPGWKGLGARSGYSTLNGIFFTIVALGGLTKLINAVVPMEAGMAIVLWIGIVITAQAYQATPRAHAPAVAIGLFPAISGWGVLILTMTLTAAGIAIESPGLSATVLGNPGAFSLAGLHLEGLVALSQGFMLTCVIWASASTVLIERQFLRASLWMAIGLVLSFFGFIHAGHLGPSGGEFDIGVGTGWRWSVGYGLAALFFVVMHYWAQRSGQTESAAVEDDEPPMEAAH
ncbi:MAG: NCS2 family permease [Deltaproteobacteria bacterium]|nr:NCS2 family permease [Deltaproteobacteria bacterium]